MHIGGQLRLRLRLREPDRFSHLQCPGSRLDLLQPGNPINPRRIRHPACIPWAGALGNSSSQAGQHIIEPTGLRIDNQLRSRRGYSDCHASNATDRH
jgi:hypothetical protein